MLILCDCKKLSFKMEKGLINKFLSKKKKKIMYDKKVEL